MDRSDEIARELVRIAASEEFNLRSTTFRQRSALGERPYAESRSRSDSVSSSQDYRNSQRRFSDPGVGSASHVSADSFRPLVNSQLPVRHIIMAGSEVKITTRFIGRFRDGVDAEKDRRYSFYTVHRWLRDTENRITSKGITTDVGKIREACLAVHPDIGDAASMVHSEMLAAMTSWEEFQAKCRFFWRTGEEMGYLPALLTLMHTPPGSTHGESAAAYSKGVVDIMNVIDSKRQLKVDLPEQWTIRKPTEKLVSLRDVMLYFAVTVFFGSLQSRAQEILIKVIDEIDFEAEDLLTIVGKFSEEMHKRRVPVSELSCMTCNFTRQGKAVKKKGNNGGAGGTQSKNKGKGKGKKNFKCYGCNKEGHFRKDCPDKQQGETKENRDREGGSREN